MNQNQTSLSVYAFYFLLTIFAITFLTALIIGEDYIPYAIFTFLGCYVSFLFFNIYRGLARFLLNSILFIIAASLTISWLIFCFGSVIIGVLLLIFAPSILFFPMAIFTLGSELVEEFIPDKEI